MFFTMCLAVCYVCSMTIVCSYFSSNVKAFTGQPELLVGCYASDDSDLPTTMMDPSASDVASMFRDTLKGGALVHALGILGDGSFAVRIFVKKTQWYRLASLILVSFYTILWLGWLIWLHIVVFYHKGKVCRGSYLPGDTSDVVLPNYAL